jgi:hypothetical protein
VLVLSETVLSETVLVIEFEHEHEHEHEHEWAHESE